MFRLRLLTAGESHGPEIIAILEGLPAGIPLEPADIAEMLRRRQEGFGRGGRMKIEKDEAIITGGVMNGLTTGGPLGLRIANRDAKNWADRDIPPMTVPRPGHADLTGAIKYGHRDLRLSLERASARETATRVAAAAVAGRLLRELGIVVGGYVVILGDVEATLAVPPTPERFAAAEESPVRCPDPAASESMEEAIQASIQDRDTLGGVIEVVALGVPPGLGSYAQWDRRLDARLAAALLGIPAMKGVEIGPAFENARRRGTDAHDEIRLEGSALKRPTNRAGGVEGGVTNGEPIVVRVAMKPLSSTLTPLASVDLATGETANTAYERSDICALPRAVVVAEAMVTLVVTDALLEKVGGDSLDEIRTRFGELRRARLEDLPMDGRPWRF